MKIPRKMRIPNFFFAISRLLLGGVFVYASIDKIAFPNEFSGVVENYEILPSVLIKPVAVLINHQSWLLRIAR